MLARDIAKDELTDAQMSDRRDAARRARFARLDRNPWIVVQDIIGTANKWPTFIREAFWSGTNFNDHQRMIVVNFAVLNGLHLDYLMNCLEFTLGFRNFHSNNRSYQAR